MVNPEKREIESHEPRILKPDTKLTPGGLPGDLWNSVFPSYLSEKEFTNGRQSEDEFRNSLRESRTFDDYYRSQVSNVNESKKEQDKNAELYDEEATIAAQREGIPDKDVISHFDEKIMELRAFADKKIIDKKILEQIEAVRDEIHIIVYGEDRKTRRERRRK